VKRPRQALAGATSGLGLVGVVIALSLTAAAGAAPVAPRPLHVAAASLVQEGQQIVWKVQLAQPFSPRALIRSRRALCLLIDAARAGVVTGEICVAGPARGSSQPRLRYMKITGKLAGPAEPVQATLTRESSSELTASFLPSVVGLGYVPFRWQVISSLRGTACAPPPAPGHGSCFELFPTKPDLLKLHSPVLTGCEPAGPSLVYHGPARGHEIALTFDDGPWSDPPTIDFLHALERADAPATFFEIGRQISSYDPDGAVERRMLADGDMIGDHTWSHPDMAKLPPAAERAQLLDSVAAIKHATGGFTPCLWRPPYGDASPSLIKLARSLGLLTVMWNVDPRDWALPGVNAIYSGVVTHATSGVIIIQHVGGGPRTETLAALPREIATLRRRGYHFVTLAQLLGLKLLYG
jgi:peptidoglycan/xylan/chitin deacetylase (PgdA/CDA1 family)